MVPQTLPVSMFHDSGVQARKALHPSTLADSLLVFGDIGHPSSSVFDHPPWADTAPLSAPQVQQPSGWGNSSGSPLYPLRS